jgi:hypothetical protein
MRARLTPAIAILLGLLAGAATLIVVELGKGAANAEKGVANPCKARAQFPGHGIDATIQRVVLDGLDGAACRLHTTREELVLSLRSGSGGGRVHWDRQTIEAAVRAGLLRSIDDNERRGAIPGFIANVARRIVKTAPLDRIIEGGIRLRDLIP